jgi:hypothetical protein
VAPLRQAVISSTISLIEALAQASRTFRARCRGAYGTGECHGVAKLQLSATAIVIKQTYRCSDSTSAVGHAGIRPDS